MPWARIDENAGDHPKVAGLSDGAFRLWVTGLLYCQKFLTDGFISNVALKGLRAYSGKRTGELVTAGLWESVASGVHVHDFLEWNESREHVIASRQTARERMRQRRTHIDVRANNSRTQHERSQNVPIGFVSGVLSSSERGVGKTAVPPPSAFVPPREPSPSEVPEAVAERAGRFCERYADLYAKHRKGARYIGKPALDFQEALQLCQTWDDERLDKIATVFLTTDHDFAERGSRTMAQFRSMASWCDSKLREAGL